MFLILVLLGLFRGWNEKIVQYIKHADADIWILQEGGDDFFNSITILPASLKEEIEENPNVKEVFPLIGRQTSFDLRDTSASIYLIGYEPEKNVGGPFKIKEGKSSPGKGEIIIDKVFASTNIREKED